MFEVGGVIDLQGEEIDIREPYLTKWGAIRSRHPAFQRFDPADWNMADMTPKHEPRYVPTH